MEDKIKELYSKRWSSYDISVELNLPFKVVCDRVSRIEKAHARERRIQNELEQV